MPVDNGLKREATGEKSTSIVDEEPRSKRPRLCQNIVIRPSDYVLAAFRVNGTKIDEVREQTNERFVPPSDEMIKAYTSQALEAVRKNDLDGIKKLHADGKLGVTPCNKFGDSLLHLACRRSHTAMVKFLIEEVKVIVNIRDDFHRTPLHDATWTALPNFDLVELLIKEMPEHLIMQDVRGFTPFDYVRQEDWGLWLRFLWERKEILKPKTCC